MNDTGVLRRDGHLTELGLERHLLEEALPEAASAHLSSCELCAARAQALAAVAPPPLPASLGGALTAVPELPRPANRGFAVTAAGIGFVAAAGALAWLAVPTGPPPDDAFQVRGGGVGLEVYARAETITRRVHDGDEVNAGERLGFRVSPSHDSYVVVLGVDRAGT